MDFSRSYNMQSLVYAGFALIILISSPTRCAEIEETVTILTDNLAYYEADITYTIQHLKELPVTEDYFSYETPTIPSLSSTGVKWSFVVLPTSLRHGSKDFGLVLNLKAVPDNTQSFEVNVECSIINRNGQREKTHHGKEIFSEPRGSFVFVDFVARSELDTEANGLLKNGHLTINCKIDGTIKPKDRVDEFVPTIELDQPSPSEYSYASNCTIAEKTLAYLATHNFELKSDATLKASGQQIELHRDIMLARSPVFQKLLSQGSTVDFGNDLGGEELKDLARFLYEGKAPGLRSSCFKLHKIAKQYQVECLLTACEAALIDGLRRDTASRTLNMAMENDATNLAREAAKYLSHRV